MPAGIESQVSGAGYAQVFTNGPGLWIAALGLAVVARAVYQMRGEPHYR